jgi:hypothetical protein
MTKDFKKLSKLLEFSLRLRVVTLGLKILVSFSII